jgi:hypothetical protein
MPGDVDRFTADGVVTKDGTEVGPFDVVVAATGYERTYDCLPAKVWQVLQHGCNHAASTQTTTMDMVA